MEISPSLRQIYKTNPEQELVTVRELASELKKSESRIRAILGKKDAPTPVYEGQHVHKGRIASLYDKEEVISFYKENWYKRKSAW